MDGGEQLVRIQKEWALRHSKCALVDILDQIAGVVCLTDGAGAQIDYFVVAL